MHHNGGEANQSSRAGSTVFFQLANPDARRLAGLVWEVTARAFSAYDIRWFSESDAGAIYRPDQDDLDYFGILRETIGTPGGLTELA